MFLSKIELNLANVREITRHAGKNPYAIHQAIWTLCGGGAEETRQFLYRQDLDARQPSFLVVSNYTLNDMRDTWRIRTKEYNPNIRNGEQLVFSLRANPIISFRDSEGKQSRHDVVMHKKKSLQSENDASVEYTMAALVQETGLQWLQARCEKYGFTITDSAIRADGYRQHVLFPGQKRRPIRFSTIEFNGLLKVTDSEQLIRTLFHGIGPAKAFGCGMLVVKRR